MSETVAVTGANGFIAAWIVSELLDNGYTVHAVVRDAKDPQKVGFLKDLAKEKDALDRLKLYSGDLLKPGSYDEAFESCGVIIHAAAVVDLTGKNSQLVVDAAVEGTRNVLSSATKSGNVQRLILLSSVSAIMDMSKPNDHVFTEKDWNTYSTVENGDAYGFAKAKQESLWWREAEAAGVEAVAINPVLVFGPVLAQTHCDSTVKSIRKMAEGDKLHKFMLMWKARLVDVRDVAIATVKAITSRKAVGRRHILCNDLAPRMLGELPPLLRAACPRYTFPLDVIEPTEDEIKKTSENAFMQRFLQRTGQIYDNTQSKEDLVKEYKSIQETLQDTVSSMVDKGFIIPAVRKDIND